jgi:hypothetical protein
MLRIGAIPRRFCPIFRCVKFTEIGVPDAKKARIIEGVACAETVLARARCDEIDRSEEENPSFCERRIRSEALNTFLIFLELIG